MGWKEFSKPTIGKIILFIILMGGLNWWIISSYVILDAMALVGLPLGFYPIGGFMEWPDKPAPPTLEFSWFNLTIDVLFWYVVSAGTVSLYHEIKKQKR